MSDEEIISEFEQPFGEEKRSVENPKYYEDPIDEWAEGPKMESVENPEYSVNNEESIRKFAKPF